jgi:DNA-binding transcriptional LysR family regulator
MEALSMRRLDIGLVRPMPGQEDFQSACVMRENVALALPIGHPLAARRRPQLAQVDGEPFIMYSPEARYFHDLLANAFQSAGVHPVYVQFMTLAQAILAMVSAGLGMAIVPEDTKNACFDNVVLRPISLGNNVTANLYAIWRGDNRNPALSAVCELVQRIEKSGM